MLHVALAYIAAPLLLLLLAPTPAAAAAPLLCTRAGGLAREHHLAAEFKHARAAFGDGDERAEEACLRRGCVFDLDARRCVYSSTKVPAPGDDHGTPRVRTVHVIHSNHFDAGYTDGVVNVLNTYFDTYFPRAVRVGAALRAKAAAWTTSSGTRSTSSHRSPNAKL